MTTVERAEGERAVAMQRPYGARRAPRVDRGPRVGMRAAAPVTHSFLPDDETVERIYEKRTKARARRADLITVVAWVSVAVAVALWLVSGGLHRIGQGALTQLGIVAGLIATDLCLLQLLLVARIPIVDRAIGHDRALAAHRRLGMGTFAGLLVHVTCLVTGVALSRQSTMPDAFFGMLQTPNLLLAALGFGALCLIGVTSIRSIKRALGHEVWHVVHLLSYAAVLLSLPHQFSGGLFAQPGPQRWYWMGLYAFAFTAIIMWRVAIPAYTSYCLGLKVSAVYAAGPDAVSIEMRGRDVDALNAAAGQFFNFRFMGKYLWWHAHPFSVSARPTRDTLRITVRSLGRGSATLQTVRPGTRVHVSGPYGIFSDDARSTTDGVVLIGAGIGIAPIRAILEETHIRRGAATVILRASAEDELYLVREIKRLCMERGARLYIALGPRAEEGWLPDLDEWLDVTLIQLAPHAAESDVFICGPQDWSAKVRDDALACGVLPSRIHDERFSW